tara:strand:+ start:439 stop:702 length:264 start_codon:yes stop_codon:yes gene_type:complete
MVKASKTDASKIKAGNRIEFDNKQFVLMLDKDGNERMGSRGALVKYGRVRVQAKVITTREDKVQVWLDTRNYDQWLKHEELVNLAVL